MITRDWDRNSMENLRAFRDGKKDGRNERSREIAAKLRQEAAHQDEFAKDELDRPDGGFPEIYQDQAERYRELATEIESEVE